MGVRRINHFKRARAMFAAIAATMALPMAEQAAAMAAIGPYCSRGKGRGTPPRDFYGRCTRWEGDTLADRWPHGQAATRRRRQIAEGTLTAANGLERRPQWANMQS